ncbi:MAG TPA: hypothetical protein VJ724_09595 [Tahibacter sp.]|nr:hypothetical protein [Tahibacter sp.]
MVDVVPADFSRPAVPGESARTGSAVDVAPVSLCPLRARHPTIATAAINAAAAILATTCRVGMFEAPGSRATAAHATQAQ